jgi:hypothetical protein
MSQIIYILFIFLQATYLLLCGVLMFYKSGCRIGNEPIRLPIKELLYLLLTYIRLLSDSKKLF